MICLLACLCACWFGLLVCWHELMWFVLFVCVACVVFVWLVCVCCVVELLFMCLLWLFVYVCINVFVCSFVCLRGLFCLFD